MSHGGNIHDVGVPGMNENSSDVTCVLQPHVLPRSARVRRFVDAVAPGGRLAILWLASSDPDQVGVGLIDGHVTDRAGLLVVKDWCPRRTVVLRLPHSARGRTDIEDLWLRFDSVYIGDAPTHIGRADRAKLETGDGGLKVRSLRMGLPGQNRGRYRKKPGKHCESHAYLERRRV